MKFNNLTIPKYITICLLLTCLNTQTKVVSQTLSSESIKWYNENLKGEHIFKQEGGKIDENELKNYFQNYDFYYIWLINQSSNFGFIGKNYNKFDIKFTSIIKSKNDKLLYNVKGKTRVCNLIFDFSGTIKIKNIRKLNFDEDYVLDAECCNGKTHETDYYSNFYITDKELREIYKNKKFLLITEWHLKADNKYLGYISGVMVTKIFEKKGFVFYDDLVYYSDSYWNNQFVGEWKNYKSKPNEKYRCNWGHIRIPYSDDLNVSCTDFCPDKKYLKYGWENYYNSLFPYDSIAYEREMNW